MITLALEDQVAYLIKVAVSKPQSQIIQDQFAQELQQAVKQTI